MQGAMCWSDMVGPKGGVAPTSNLAGAQGDCGREKEMMALPAMRQYTVVSMMAEKSYSRRTGRY